MNQLLCSLPDLIRFRFLYKYAHDQPHRHNYINDDPHLPAQRNCGQWLEKHRQSQIYNDKRDVLPFIFVIRKDGEPDHGNEPDELIISIGHVEQAYQQQGGKDKFSQVFGGGFHKGQVKYYPVQFRYKKPSPNSSPNIE